MLYRLTADALVVVHLGFIIFVVVGGFLTWHWRRLAWLHIPIALWGALIEFTGWTCPLTPLENELRRLAGDMGYDGGFIEHYVIQIVYPATLTSAMQIGLGSLVLLLNGIAYSVYFTRRRSE